ncbi:MAG: hypothetical protein J6S21_03440 [Victivallales bacterium]|nr:hypothetical protein [Victivallales bacterium]
MDNKLSFRLLKNSLLLSFHLCLGITTIIFSIGTLHNQSLGYTKKEIVFTSDTAYFLFPPEASATLVFVHQHPINNTQTENNFLSENMINIIRKELRPAAQKGFNAVYTPLYFFNSVMEHLSSQNTRSGKIIVLPDTPSTAELISNPNLIKTQYEITISYLNPASAHFTETHYATNAIPRNIFLFQNSNVIDEVFFHSLATTHQAVNVFTINENNHFDERIKIISENFELF